MSDEQVSRLAQACIHMEELDILLSDLVEDLQGL